jgi:transcription termination factor NusB
MHLNFRGAFFIFVKNENAMTINDIEKSIDPLKNQLLNHSLYNKIKSIEDLEIFLQHHVYAVWDFMSLLKALQQHLTCVSLPWQPANNTSVARFINEIVMEEESDFNEKGEAKSHFEMYLDAMQEVNADTQKVEAIISSFTSLKTISGQIETAQLNQAEKNFLQFTFRVINSQQPHLIAAAFTFGREDLIPDMFLGIIEQSGENGPSNYKKLEYYLKRHIELDGDEHGPLAMRMIQALCGSDDQKWNDVLEYSKQALQYRIELWDSIAENLKENKGNLVNAL